MCKHYSQHSTNNKMKRLTILKMCCLMMLEGIRSAYKQYYQSILATGLGKRILVQRNFRLFRRSVKDTEIADKLVKKDVVLMH